jgi:hypothetical protein
MTSPVSSGNQGQTVNSKYGRANGLKCFRFIHPMGQMTGRIASE